MDLSESEQHLPLLAANGAAAATTLASIKRPPMLAQRAHGVVPVRLQGVFLVAVSALMMSVLSVLVKYASYSMPSTETAFWRSSITWVLNWVAMRVYNVNTRVPREFWPALAARCLFGWLGMLLSFYAMQQMVLADANVLISTTPVMTFFLGALLLKERVDPVSLGCAVFSFVGVICVLRPTFLFHQSTLSNGKTNSKAAVWCALLSAAAVAVVYVSMRRLQQLHFLVVINYFSLAASLGSLVPLLLQRSFVLHMTLATWLAALGCGAVGFVVQLFLTRGFQLENAGVASVMSYLSVVFVFVWDAVLLHEPINAWSAVGAGIILACTVVIAVRRMNSK